MVPFLFIIAPALLLLGDDNVQVLIDVFTALVGVYLISVAAIGYFRRPINSLMRLSSHYRVRRHYPRQCGRVG